MKLAIYVALTALTIYIVYLSTSSVRHGEINFFTDVARDFLLLQELDAKKIVLIGPRSNTNGLFHGPLWTYMNYPAYVLARGNPVTVGWFWIFLECTFLATGFFMVRKLFGYLPAFVYILLTATRMALHINGVFHAEANFFFALFFFFTIYMYVNCKKNLYLALHILALCILIQLNVGVGIQFFILSIPLLFWFIIKNKLTKHLFTFALIPLFLLNFVIFDLRHDLRMAKALISTGGASHFFVPIGFWIENRVNNIVSLQISEQNGGNNLLNYIIFILVIIFTVLHIKNKSKYKIVYLLLPFYYFGYIILSFFNKGVLLFHYTYLLIPLTTLWLVSFLGDKYNKKNAPSVSFLRLDKIIFIPLLCIVFITNFNYVLGDINSKGEYVGTGFNSWKGLSEVAKEVINEQKGKEFGYFVFAPDAYAYQPRYAMIYNFKIAKADAFEYVKKPTTYIIAAPAPANDPYMTYVWWRKNAVKIASQPVKTKTFRNGFTIEKFILKDDEQKNPHDKNIELGIHFR